MKKTILSALLLMFAVSAFSQIKLGHINSAELMEKMPELQKAQEELQSHNKELEATLRTMMTEYENQLTDYQANQAQWSDLIKQTKAKTIQDLEARIQDFRQNAEKDFEAQREKLFAPIIEKAKKAIEEVAKEHKYAYIFDSSGGTLLYSSDSDNVMELVKKKLDLK